MRGLARFGDDLPDTFAELVDGGALCITVESTGKAERYQSIVPLPDDNLAACLEHYYQQSVQLPTMFMLAANDQHAAGLMLQVMPERQGGNGRWAELLAQLEGLDIARLSQVDEALLLTALFPEDDIRLLDSEPVCFHCDCSVERIENMLHMLGAAELADLLNDPGPVEIRCEFCNELYVIPAERIQGIVSELTRTQGGALH
jgi:molecular chaperone Hsp33